MGTCIRCKGQTHGAEGETICVICAGEIVDHYATHDEMIALAKTGIDALIDEATGYQKIRPPNDLRERYKKYYGKRLSIFKEITKRLPEKTNCWKIEPGKGKNEVPPPAEF